MGDQKLILSRFYVFANEGDHDSGAKTILFSGKLPFLLKIQKK